MRRDIVFLVVLALVAAGAVFAATLPAPQVGPVKVSNDPVTPVQTTPVPAYNDGWYDVFPVQMGADLKDGGRHLDYIDSTAMFDSLEGDCTAWAGADLDAGWFWRRDDTLHLPHLNDTSWWCADLCLNAPGFKGGYNDHWLQFLVSDTFDLTATTTPTLKFKARWKIEVVAGTDPPWDMWDGWNCWGSTNAGETWSVLGSVTPRYSDFGGTSSWAFGHDGQGWGYGPGIPAFGDTNSQEWQEISYDLYAGGTGFMAGKDSCMVRWAFASDQGWCSIDDPSFFCLIVDSIRVNTDQGIKLSNDGEQGEFTFDRGPGALGTWVYDNTESHSPTHCWSIANDTSITLGLVSYPITLPAGYDFLTMRYWVWCDWPDFSLPGSNSLLDYYQIVISDAACPAYEQVVYDYAYDNGEPPPGGNSLTGWVQRAEGLGVINEVVTGVPIDLMPWAGQTVRIAFGVTTDDTLITGTGLHIDDVEIIASRRYAHDLALRDLVVPFPTTYGLQADLQYNVYNDGANGEKPINTDYWIEDPNASISSGSVNIADSFYTGDDSTITILWTPDVCGSWRLGAACILAGDVDPSNDTLETPINSPETDPNENLAVSVLPEGLYELAYHARSAGNYFFYPRYTRFTPVDDGVPSPDVDNYDMLRLKVMWMYHPALSDTGGTVWIEFWEDSTAENPSTTLIHRIVTKIDTTETVGSSLSDHWWIFDLDTIPVLQNRSGDFWVSIAGQDSALHDGDLREVPNVLGLGTDETVSDGHSFILLDDGLTFSTGRFLIQVTIGEVKPVDNLTVFRDGATDDVTLRWSSPTSCPSANVYRLTDPMQDYTTGTLLTPTPITDTFYKDVNAVASVKYFYVVTVAY